MSDNVATLRGAWRAPLPDRLLLWLALLQGSSLTLSLALHLPSGHAGTLATLVSALWGLMYLVSAGGLFAAFGINWITWLVRYRLLLVLLIGGAALSVLWSLDARLSVERVAHLIGTTLVALYIGFRLPLAEILRIAARALALLLVLSALAALLYPPLGLEDYQGRLVWRGVTASKNTLGFWAAVSVLLFLSRASVPGPLARRLGDLAVAALALACLTMSVSATSALSLVIALLVMLYLHAATELRLGQVAMAVTGVLVTALVALAVRSIDTAELIGRSGDLTGRAQVWVETWRLILERPLGGYGYGVLWFPTEASLWIQKSLTDLNWTVYHAHNGILHLASEIGLPLTALAVLLIAQQLVESVWCQYRRPQPGVLFVTGFSVALLVSNYAEARLLINRDLFWILLVALPISMLQQVMIVPAEHARVPAGHTRPKHGAPAPGGVARTVGTPAARRERLARARETKRRLKGRKTETET